MAAQDNKAISRRFFEEVWNEGNLDAINDLVADDVVFRPSGTEELHGPEAAGEYVSRYRSAFPDLRFTIEEQIAEGDKVATRWTASGTHGGELMGVPPTRKTSTVTGITLDHIVNGKHVESVANWDALGMLHQLGVLPQPVGGQ